MATAVKQISPNCKVIGVEPQHCASWSAAIESGEPVSVNAAATLAMFMATVG